MGTEHCLTTGCLVGRFASFTAGDRLLLVKKGGKKQTDSLALLKIGYLSLEVREKTMAPHSGTLAWKIPWTEEPGGLQSMGSLQVGHDWATSLSLFTFMRWKRKWQPTPEFLPGESQGQGSLVGCHLWGRTESDTTEATQQQQAWRWGRFENEGHVWVRPLLSAVQCLLNKIQQVTDTANTDNLQKLKSL